jgi:hypothetical protein
MCADRSTNKTTSANTASAEMNETQTAASIATIDQIKYNLVFLNTTAPSYVLLDHSNAEVIIWTVSGKPSTSPHVTVLKRVLTHVASWLPLLEPLVMLTSLWKIRRWMRQKRTERREERRAAEQEN